MKLIYLVFFTFIVTSSYSEEIEVFRAKGRTYLKAPKCDVLDKQVDALKSWSQKLGESTYMNPQCTCLSGECRIDVTRVSPMLLQQYEGHTPANIGMNCFGSTLKANKILPALGYASSNEMEFYLRSKLCTQLPPKSVKSPGDIIHIVDPTVFPRARHSFNYITEDLAFSKNGTGGIGPTGVINYPYELLHPNKVYKHPGFQIADQCIDVGAEEAKKLGCKGYIQFYRCQSMDQYLKRNKMPIETKQTWIKLQELDKQMSLEVQHKPGKNQKKKELYVEIFQILNLARLRSKQPATKNDFFWKAIKHRVESLDSQHKQIN